MVSNQRVVHIEADKFYFSHVQGAIDEDLHRRSRLRVCHSGIEDTFSRERSIFFLGIFSGLFSGIVFGFFLRSVFGAQSLDGLFYQI